MGDSYLTVTQESGRAFVMRGLEGPVEMLNLLRFREVADYSGSPELAPPAPISGAAAYARYMAHTEPFLRAAGGALIYDADGGPLLIGAPGERWDRVLIVRYPDAKTFLSFATDRAYLTGLGHRTAALADSRLLPMSAR